MQWLVEHKVVSAPPPCNISRRNRIICGDYSRRTGNMLSELLAHYIYLWRCASSICCTYYEDSRAILLLFKARYWGEWDLIHMQTWIIWKMIAYIMEKMFIKDFFFSVIDRFRLIIFLFQDFLWYVYLYKIISVINVAFSCNCPFAASIYCTYAFELILKKSRQLNEYIQCW